MLYANQPNKGVQQLCQGYNSKVLMGNWLEHRQAHPQPLKLNYDATKIREKQTNIAFPSGVGMLLPLRSLARRQKWATKDIVIPNDGYNQTKTTNQTFMTKPACVPVPSVCKAQPSLQNVQRKKAQSFMLSLNNVQQAKPRNETGRGFTKTISTHRPDHGQLSFTHHYGTTEYKASYVGNQKSNSRSVKEEFSHRAQASGYGSFTQKQSKLQECKQITNLVSQVYNKGCDPKDNIQVRRTWLPVRDKALVHANANLEINKEKNRQTSLAPRRELQTYKANTNQTLQKDIMTSTNIAEGMQKIHPVEVGQFRRVRQDVTLQYNKVWSKK